MDASHASEKRIFIEVGAGELIDKITILHIKSARITQDEKRANVAYELAALEPARADLVRDFPQVAALENELRAINEALWEIEDAIRECEAHEDFGPRFVELARAVYKTNDRRASLKKQINSVSGARIIEEKSYRAP